MRMRRNRARTGFIKTAQVYASCARADGRIFKKKLLVVDYYLRSVTLKFHTDPNFRLGVTSLFVNLYNFDLNILGFLFNLQLKLILNGQI